MGVSVQICLMVTTRNRRDCLARLLESLKAQTWPSFTTVLGLQTPETATRELVESYQRELTILPVELPACGLSAARNALLPYVQGEIVALTDDDCHYAPDTLRNVAEAFMTHPEMAICVGQDAQKTESRNKPDVLNRYTVFQDAPSWTLFFRRTAVEQVGLFDESLGIGADTPWQSGEETDYLLRALEVGQKVLRVPGIRIYHPQPDFKRPGMVNKWNSYGMGRMRVLVKHSLPFWFVTLNLAYPLCFFFRYPTRASYYFHIFKGRIRGIHQCLAKQRHSR